MFYKKANLAASFSIPSPKPIMVNTEDGTLLLIGDDGHYYVWNEDDTTIFHLVDERNDDVKAAREVMACPRLLEWEEVADAGHTIKI